MRERSFSRPTARAPTLLFAITAGLAVGNAYAAQPLLDAIAAAFSLSPGLAGAVVTATQAGLALGAVYALSAAAALLLAVLLVRRLPPERPTPAAPPAPAARRYAALVGSTFALIPRMPLLRTRGTLALLVFAAFSTLWSALALPLAAPPHGLSPGQIGLFGLAGLAGALAAARAGRLADRGHAQATTGAALALLLLSWLPIAPLDRSLLALAVGVVLLDLAAQAVHVVNQTLLLEGARPARSRVTGAYMLFYSAGSAGGAIAATAVYAAWGWSAVCAQGAALSLSALLVWGFTRRRRG